MITCLAGGRDPLHRLWKALHRPLTSLKISGSKWSSDHAIHTDHVIIIGTQSWFYCFDGTHLVVHQCAANPAGGAQKQVMGRTRGGCNTKVMTLIDGRDLPVKLLLIDGWAYEGKYVIPLLEARQLLMLVGDKGFVSDPLRRQLEQLGAPHCISSKSNRRKKRRFNNKLYRQRCKGRTTSTA